MSERIESGSLTLVTNQLHAVKAISTEALQKVDKNFGTGYLAEERPQREEGLPYHNGHHARFVGDTALKMARAIGLSSAEAKIAELAGHAHDIVQGRGHELDGALWLEDVLRQQGVFPKAAVEMGSLAILGTAPIFEDGVVVSQHATRQEYPSKYAEKVAYSVACADLGDIYMPQGPLLAHELYREIKKSEAIDDSLVQFQRNQSRFLDSYNYPLPEANDLLATHRAEVVDHQERILEKLLKGEIDTWQQLIELDTALYREHQT